MMLEDDDATSDEDDTAALEEDASALEDDASALDETTNDDDDGSALLEETTAVADELSMVLEDGGSETLLLLSMALLPAADDATALLDGCALLAAEELKSARDDAMPPLVMVLLPMVLERLLLLRPALLAVVELVLDVPVPEVVPSELPPVFPDALPGSTQNAPLQSSPSAQSSTLLHCLAQVPLRQPYPCAQSSWLTHPNAPRVGQPAKATAKASHTTIRAHSVTRDMPLNQTTAGTRTASGARVVCCAQAQGLATVRNVEPGRWFSYSARSHAGVRLVAAMRTSSRSP